MTYKEAYLRLVSPGCHSINALRAAALFILRYGKHAAPADVNKAKRVLKGDTQRHRDRWSTERWLQIQVSKRLSRERRALRKAGVLEQVAMLRAKAETGADFAEIARIETAALAPMRRGWLFGRAA